MEKISNTYCYAEEYVYFCKIQMVGPYSLEDFWEFYKR